MPFLALLKLLSPKEWLVVVAIIALGVGGAWIYHDGEQHRAAQDAKLAAIDAKKVTAVETTAKDTESHNDTLYRQTVSAPAVASVGIKCVRNATSAVSLPAADTGTRAATGQSSSDSGSGPTYDPSGAALTRAREADAQIKYLQARVRELEFEMNGAP
jgi:hypothetical protein